MKCVFKSSIIQIYTNLKTIYNLSEPRQHILFIYYKNHIIWQTAPMQARVELLADTPPPLPLHAAPAAALSPYVIHTLLPPPQPHPSTSYIYVIHYLVKIWVVATVDLKIIIYTLYKFTAKHIFKQINVIKRCLVITKDVLIFFCKGHTTQEKSISHRFQPLWNGSVVLII